MYGTAYSIAVSFCVPGNRRLTSDTIITISFHMMSSLAGANPAVNTPRPSRGTRQDRIMRFYCLDWWSLILLVCFILLGLACRVGAMGSIYILCLTCRLRRLTVWSLIFLGFFSFLFQLSRVCRLFWVLLFPFDFFHNVYPFWVVSL